jgi:uncharacterized protein (TIGR01777 family)
MRIAITGHTGLVGRSLAEGLRADGHAVIGISRRPPPPGSEDVRWDPVAGLLPAEPLEGLDAVVHLAGEGVAEGRWTPARKAAIRNSRTEGTRLLAGTLAALSRKPAAFLSASAVGYYGDTGDRTATEADAPGGDFLADVCREWEAAVGPAEAAGIRVCRMRVGIVLAREGGVLAKLTPPIRLGVGGRLGNGRQWMSWITRTDIVRAMRFLLEREDLSGAFNLVGPAPATNAELTRVLGRVLRRPTLLPVPAFALKLLFGEMGEAVILQNARVLPARLQEAGFTWRHPELEAALRAALEMPTG